jgi:ribose 5-phosphate isomerase A
MIPMKPPIPLISKRALEFVQDGDVVGLGTGSAATAFIHALGERVRTGLRVRGVPTSEATAQLARQLGILLVTLEELDGDRPINITVDGADEVDANLNLVKGLGGALVREKIVASAARRLVILIGPEKLENKLNPVVGTRGVLPVEVVRFGWGQTRRRLSALGCPSTPRQPGSALFVTDNGNYILDGQIKPLTDPAAFEREVLAIPGVVGTGLFLGMSPTVLVQEGEVVHVRQRSLS